MNREACERCTILKDEGKREMRKAVSVLKDIEKGSQY
jgi:hypothetical protein